MAIQTPLVRRSGRLHRLAKAVDVMREEAKINPALRNTTVTSFLLQAAESLEQASEIYWIAQREVDNDKCRPWKKKVPPQK